MQGHVQGMFNFGCYEGDKGIGNHERAVRHFSISAKMGHKESLDKIKKRFMLGIATKEQYEALKGYQDAVGEMKSHDRDEVKGLRDVVKTALGGQRVQIEIMQGH